MSGAALPRSGLAEVLDRLAGLETRQRETDFDALRAAVLEGEDGAWKRFVEKYSRFVYTVALRLVAGSREPQEAAAAIYAATFERLAAAGHRLLRGFGGRCRFTTYLYRIVLSERKDYFRRERRGLAEPLGERARPPVVAGPEAAPVLRPELLHDTVRVALAGLGAVERALLLCRFRDGLKLRELAELFDLADTNAAARALYRALSRLDLLRALDRRSRLGPEEREALAVALDEQLFGLRRAAGEEA